jgi:hypothetical protein
VVGRGLIGRRHFDNGGVAAESGPDHQADRHGMWKFRLDGPGDGRVLLIAAILAKMRRRKKMIKMKRNLARALSIWKS